MHALARELARLGHRVEVVTPTPGPREQEGVRVHRLRGHPIPRVGLAWMPAAYDHVRELVRPERFDVVHCHGGVVSPVAYYAAYVAQRAGIPTVVTTHSVQAYVAPALRLLDRWIGWSGWPVVLWR